MLPYRCVSPQCAMPLCQSYTRFDACPVSCLRCMSPCSTPVLLLSLLSPGSRPVSAGSLCCKLVLALPDFKPTQANKHSQSSRLALTRLSRELALTSLVCHTCTAVQLPSGFSCSASWHVPMTVSHIADCTCHPSPFDPPYLCRRPLESFIAERFSLLEQRLKKAEVTCCVSSAYFFHFNSLSRWHRPNCRSNSRARDSPRRTISKAEPSRFARRISLT